MKIRGIIITAILFFFCFEKMELIAQDTIVKINGDTIEAKVIKITPEVLEYYKHGRLDGPIYTIYIEDVLSIIYPDRSVDEFGSESNEKIDENENNTIKENDDLGNSFVDERDGRKYKIVKIGEQIWMAENLKYNTGYSDCYKEDTSKCEECGQYYNFEEACIVCPEGWHLPTDEEWEKLEMAAGMRYTEVVKKGWRGTSPGQAPDLLEGGKTELGLKLCGYKEYRYCYLDTEAFYWTATKSGKNYILIRHFKRRASIERTTTHINYRLNVRCIKN